MAGHKPFKLLRDKMSPAQRAAIDARVQETLHEMRLKDLREELGTTQEELGALLDVRQAAVARLEARSDMPVTTLYKIICALGGELEIHARFPEGAIKITQFENLS